MCYNVSCQTADRLLASTLPRCEINVSGMFAGRQGTRPPDIGWSSAGIVHVCRWLKERYPMFVADESAGR